MTDDELERIRATLELPPFDEDDAAARALLGFQSRLRTPAEVKSMPRPNYLLDGLIVENTLGLIWGPWGSCKTFLALTWAGFIGSGSWWLGRSVTQTKVLHVACEGVGGLGSRIEAFERGHSLYNMSGVTLHEGRINLLDRGEVSGFAQGVAEAGYGLIFIDTLARSMPGGDENSAKDVGMVVDALDTVRQASGSAVFALHHSTKEGSSARGLSAYLGACDTELEVSAVGTQVTLKVHQQRDAEKADSIILSLEPVPGTDSATLVDGRGKAISIAGTAIKVLEALDDDPERGVSASTWSATSGVAPTTFHRHRRVLLDEGLVGTLPGTRLPRYVLTEQGRNEIGAIGATEVPPCE